MVTFGQFYSFQNLNYAENKMLINQVDMIYIRIAGLHDIYHTVLLNIRG